MSGAAEAAREAWEGLRAVQRAELALERTGWPVTSD